MEKILLFIITASGLCSVSSLAAHHYHFIYEKRNWTEAVRYCRENYMDLATIENLEEMQILKTMAQSDSRSADPYGFWIGYHDFDDQWRWADGSSSSFTYWSPVEPNGEEEDCARINFKNSGLWEDWHCDWNATFICYSVPVSKHVVKMKLETSLDLNDPAVMDNILKELKQKLKDQGVSGDIKLSWRKQSDGKIFHMEGEQKDEL